MLFERNRNNMIKERRLRNILWILSILVRKIRGTKGGIGHMVADPQGWGRRKHVATMG